MPLIVINATDPDQPYQNPSAEYYNTADPAVLPTCLRGCLCGYSATYPYEDISVYSDCDCQQTLGYLFYYVAITKQGEKSPPTTVYTTPTNLSLLDHYDVPYDDFNGSITSVSLAHETPLWVNVSEGSNLTLQKGFECFGDYQTIADIIPPSP